MIRTKGLAKRIAYDSRGSFRFPIRPDTSINFRLRYPSTSSGRAGKGKISSKRGVYHEPVELLSSHPVHPELVEGLIRTVLIIKWIINFYTLLRRLSKPSTSSDRTEEGLLSLSKY